jgi:hypothetical protein
VGPYCCEKQLNSCELSNVDDDDDGDSKNNKNNNSNKIKKDNLTYSE